MVVATQYGRGFGSSRRVPTLLHTAARICRIYAGIAAVPVVLAYYSCTSCSRTRTRTTGSRSSTGRYSACIARYSNRILLPR